jgi:hypothetical protein
MINDILRRAAVIITLGVRVREREKKREPAAREQPLLIVMQRGLRVEQRKRGEN